jgi:LmbE family N-acetylglucosaminyl deacetylase
MAETLRLLILGAHPDDAEFHAGGLATLYRRAGHVVKMVSLTNGDAGHHRLRGPELAASRRAEAACAANVIGATSAVWSHADGRLEPTLELRWQVICEIRTFRPDLVLTHRTEDYHPDHRAVGNVVRDASYLVTVPAICPEVPALVRDPVVAYMADRFTRPAPLAGDVVLDVGDCLNSIVDMLACHRSQVFEWLPYNQGIADQVPPDEVARRAWLTAWYQRWLRPQADRYRAELIAQYGAERGQQVEFAEVYEISQYAAPLDAAARERLFGFLYG